MTYKDSWVLMRTVFIILTLFDSSDIDSITITSEFSLFQHLVHNKIPWVEFHDVFVFLFIEGLRVERYTKLTVWYAPWF